MPTHSERRKVPYTARQMYDLVLDIERYGEFLPWCRQARITKLEGATIVADLEIGFRMIREKFTSRVTCAEDDTSLSVEYLAGPLKYLHSHWKFVPCDSGGCEIHFDISFEFRSRLMEKLMSALFNEVVYRMVSAFERRARQLHGRQTRKVSSNPQESDKDSGVSGLEGEPLKG